MVFAICHAFGKCTEKVVHRPGAVTIRCFQAWPVFVWFNPGVFHVPAQAASACAAELLQKPVSDHPCQHGSDSLMLEFIDLLCGVLFGGRPPLAEAATMTVAQLAQHMKECMHLVSVLLHQVEAAPTEQRTEQLQEIWLR
jgi:hypothetical protein